MASLPQIIRQENVFSVGLPREIGQIIPTNRSSVRGNWSKSKVTYIWGWPVRIYFEGSNGVVDSGDDISRPAILLLLRELSVNCDDIHIA